MYNRAARAPQAPITDGNGFETSAVRWYLDGCWQVASLAGCRGPEVIQVSENTIKWINNTRFRRHIARRESTGEQYLGRTEKLKNR
jgi:hypothetical protein